MTVDAASGLIVERNVPVPMRDGVRLLADLYRPAEGGPFPVLLMRTPYDKTQAVSNLYAHPEWYARQGYLVVMQDTRGRWASEGEFYPFRHEMADGYDTVEWAAALPAANGRVGMFGGSYVGATQMLAAVAAPPHLTCITPAITSSQYYDGWTYSGGALSLAFAVSWALGLAGDTAHRRERYGLEWDLYEARNVDAARIYLMQPLSAIEVLRRDDVAPYFFDWLAHPTYDDYWRQWSIDERYEQVRVPALHIGGWYDIFRDGTIKNFQGLRERAATEEARRGQRLLLGPWYHVPWTPLMGQADFGEEARNAADPLLVRWFDYWLKGDQTGIRDEPPVRAFAMGANRWLTFSTWPPAEAQTVELYLHSAGRANSLSGDGALSAEKPGDELPDVYVYDPRSPIQSLGGNSCCNPAITPMGPMDQRPVEVLNSVLVYTGEVLSDELLVAGSVSLDLWVASSAVDTDFTAKLVDVYPDGRAINLTAGILRAKLRDSLSQPRLLTPGEVYRLTIELGNTCNLFLPGHRIRLEVTSSNFPHWERNTNTGSTPALDSFSQVVAATQHVFHDANRPSRLRLPVVKA